MVAETDTILTIPRRVAEAYAMMPNLALLRPPLPIERFTYRLWHERSHRDPAMALLRQMIALAVSHQRRG